MQLCNYAIMQLCNYAIMQLCNYAIMQLCNYAIMQLCNYAIMLTVDYVRHKIQIKMKASLVTQCWQLNPIELIQRSVERS
jgi:hypothetical protein